MQKFADGLGIEIQVFDFATKQIYRSTENPIKIYLLKSENHYDVISNIAGFLCENDDHCKAEKRRCKACNNEPKCDTQNVRRNVKNVLNYSTANNVLIII